MKILVVDDHVLLREALRYALKELDGDAAIFEASDGRDAMQIVQQHPDLDLVLLDLNLPDRDGFGMLAEFRKRFPVVVISAIQDRDSIIRALDLGALGFIPKSASRKVIVGALQLVFAGEMYIPPQVLSHPGLPPPRESPSAVLVGIATDRPAALPTDLGLTERQLDVLALMMRGNSNKAICRELKLAEPTVKAHVHAILNVLGVSNRTEAVVAISERWESLSILKSWVTRAAASKRD
jgi:DNA-binding NarL/FixJ family response regulator